MISAVNHWRAETPNKGRQIFAQAVGIIRVDLLIYKILVESSLSLRLVA